MPELSNDNLSLWLKARDGLPCEEARALIERIGESEAEVEAEVEAVHREYEGWVSPEEYDSAVADAAEQTGAYSEGWDEGLAEGKKRGRSEAARRVRAIVQGPGWGPPPTKSKMVAELLALAQEWSRTPETV